MTKMVYLQIIFLFTVGKPLLNIDKVITFIVKITEFYGCFFV